MVRDTEARATKLRKNGRNLHDEPSLLRVQQETQRPANPQPTVERDRLRQPIVEDHEGIERLHRERKDLNLAAPEVAHPLQQGSARRAANFEPIEGDDVRK